MKKSRLESDDNSSEDERRYREDLRTGEYISQEAMLERLDELAMHAAVKIARQTAD